MTEFSKSAVLSLENLYVADSSVFPTPGSGTPTLLSRSPSRRSPEDAALFLTRAGIRKSVVEVDPHVAGPPGLLGLYHVE